MTAAGVKSSLHPTKEKLIATFLQLGEDRDLSLITVDAVLEESGVSKGSLYHHFQDFDDLAGQAMAHLFSTGISRSIYLMRVMLDKSETAEDFTSRIRTLILDTLTPDGIRQRLMRARILGASMKFPKLDNYIRNEQRKLTDEIACMFLDAKYKGFVRMDIDPNLAAVFIQAYTFGKIVDDISEAPIAPDDWTDWIMSILDYKILS